MSSIAAWSYTRKATHWPRLSRDDWSGVQTWGTPVVFACDYMAKAERRTASNGEEFTTRFVIHTERDSIKADDMVLVGESSALDPVAAGAQEVKGVTRFSDTFEQVRDDFEVLT